MFRPAARHWFFLALCFLGINAGGMACLLRWGHLNRDGLRVRSFTPEGETEEQTKVRVTFDRAVVGPAAVGIPLDRPPVRFVPPIAGTGLWESPRILCFHPDQALPRATPFSAMVDRGLRARDGHALVGRSTFEFHTERLKWLKARQVEAGDFHPTICLTFSDKVAPAEVRRLLKLSDAQGKPVPFRIRDCNLSKRVYVCAKRRVENGLKAVLEPGLRGVSGPLGLTGEQARSVDITGALRIVHVYARNPRGARPYLVVETTQRLSLKDAASTISVKPPVKFHVESYYWDGVKLYGEFDYATKYELKFSKQLKAHSGETLGRDVTWTLDTPDAQRDVAFVSDGIYLSTKGSLRLPVECMNVKGVRVNVEKIYTNNIVHYVSERRRYGQPRYLGYRLPDAKIEVKGRHNVSTRVSLDLRKLLGDGLAGPTLITIRGFKHDWPSRTKLVLVTNMGLTVKRSSHDLLVWANAIDDASPLTRAKVSVLTRTNQTVLEGLTDDEGFVHFKDVDLAGDREPYIVAAAKAGDISYVCLPERAVATSDFDVDGIAPLREGYEALVYTDRGVYRPGERVYLNAVVRGRSMALPPQFPVEFEVRRPDDRLARRVSVGLSERGTAATVFAAPADAVTGRYVARVRVPGQHDEMGSVSFLVEEFMPDRMKAEIVLSDGPVVAGQKVDVIVKGSHLLGHAAVGRTASCRASLKPCPFAHADWQGYCFFDATRDWSAIDVDMGEAVLDDKGQHAFSLAVPERAGAPARLRACIGASVKEIGGRAVSAYEEQFIDLYPFYVGASRPTGDPADKGLVLIECVTVRADGRLFPAKSLRCALEKLVWHTVLKRGSDDLYHFVSKEEAVPVSAFDLALENGRGTARLRPPSRGNFRIRVVDPKHGAATSVQFWRSGSGNTSWGLKRPDRVEVTVDREGYVPGDVAKVVVRSPFAGRLGFFVENDGVLVRRVLEMTGNTAELAVPIGPDFGPTAYVSAIVIRPLRRGEPGAVHRAVGICPIAVADPETRLTVKLSVPAEVRPNEPVSVPFSVVRGASAPGAGAQVAIAAVDVGVCRLTQFETPDPWGFFNAKRRLVEQTSDVYSWIHPEFAADSVGSSSTPSGDGDSSGSRLLNPIRAKRVTPVALWLGTFAADAEGKGMAEFTAPDFDGRLRLMAVAVGKTAVGCGQADCVVANPVLVSASLPRFASIGDVFELPVTVTNRTGQAGEVVVSVAATGALQVDSSDDDRFQLAKDGEETRRFTLRASGAPGKGMVGIFVELNHERSTRHVELAVRPPAPRTLVSGAGSVDSGKTAAVQLPKNFMRTGLKRKLHVSGLPGIELGRALNYVLRYPYGCAEQTTSAAFPLLYARSIAKAVAPERFQEQTVEQYVQAGIDRLLMMQTIDGGIAYWPGSCNDSPWVSAYAGHFLVEAGKAGYHVPKSAMGTLLSRLERIAADEDDLSPAVRCYACHVLALAGRPQARWVRKLSRNPDELWVSSRCHLAAALTVAGDRAGALKLLGSGMPPGNTERMRGGALRSHPRECAIMLSTLLDVAPEDTRVPTLVSRLNKASRSGCWYTTQENAFAIFALGKYAKAFAGEPSRFVARVQVGDALAAEVTSENPRTITLSPGQSSTLQLLVKGAGRAYYYWSVEGIPADGKIDEVDAGMKVRRQYLTRDNAEVEGNRFEQGEVYQVKLSFRAAEDLDNVVAVDLLPGGLEIENPRLATRQQDMPRPAEGITPDRVEMRDDRLILFFDLEAGKWREFRYLVRAVTEGKFALGPARAECMYDPDVSSVSGLGRCVVYRD